MKNSYLGSVSSLATLALLSVVLAGCEHEKSSSDTKMSAVQGTKGVPLETMLAEKGDSNPDVRKGVEFLLAGDYSQASRHLNSALFQDQTNPWVHYLNALSYQMMAEKGDAAQYDLAQSGFENALKYDPTNVMASLQLARVYTAKKEYVKAQEELANVLLLEPSQKDAAYELAHVSYLMGDIKSAHAAIARAALISPDRPEVRKAQAMILAASGKKEQALASLAQYKKITKKPEDVSKVQRRLQDWDHLYASGLVLAQEDAASDAVPEDSVPADAAPGDPVAAAAAQAGAPVVEENKEMIVLDAVVLRVSEIGSTKKGNNILENFTLGIAPGTYGRGWAEANGGGATSLPFGVGGSSFTAGAAGLSNTRIFTQGIGFSTINYNLNIANASREYVEVVGRPSLVASVGKPATFFSGRELTLGLTGQNGGSIQKIPVGSTLKVTPTSMSAGKVTLDISLYGSLITDTTLLTYDPSARWTDVGLSKVTTTIEVPVGHTIMLGGITERIDIHSKKGFPLLQDIPGLQYLFSQEATESQRKSVMYLITPRSYTQNREHAQNLTELGDRRLNMKELEQRHKNWFDPDYNTSVILKHLAPLYREFRKGDLDPLWWNMPEHVETQVEQAVSFLYY
jgi:tetratricopeptide (TPR) repeat protein